MNLKIARENEHEIWVYCPFHGPETEASMIINKAGEYAGKYRCFGCGEHGKAKDLGLDIKAKRVPKKRQKKDWYSIWNIYHAIGKLRDVNQNNDLALEWYVSKKTLYNYGYGYNPEEKCHIIPMVNENLCIIGIQKRYDNGRKISIKGSRLGLFMHKDWAVLPKDTMYITEGASDCICCADLGFTTIGRPSATSCEDMVVNLCSIYVSKSSKIIIVADNDAPGMSGASNLQSHLYRAGFKRVYFRIPRPHKDLRKMIEVEGKERVKQFLEK